MRNGSLLRNILVFEKEVISLKWWKTSSAEAFYFASESTQSCTRVFFLLLFSCYFNDYLSPSFTDWLFYDVGIHQMRILVFDNYQTWPVPLSWLLEEHKILFFFSLLTEIVQTYVKKNLSEPFRSDLGINKAQKIINSKQTDNLPPPQHKKKQNPMSYIVQHED